MAPINIRSDKDTSGGNIVATMTVQVRSDVADPLERLQAVHDSSSKAKELTNAIGAKAMTDYTQFIPSMLTAQAARLASRWGLANHMNPSFNCVITNVPGPPIPLYHTGAKMVANFGTGPVQDGVGLFHVIGSYCGQFTISATSCRVMMPDPDFYRQCLQDSFDELLAAANSTVKATAAKSKRATSTKPKPKPKPKRAAQA
jgi:diacylglycerol O-acyltransferase